MKKFLSDGHIHLTSDTKEGRGEFARRLKIPGMRAALLISLPPRSSAYSPDMITGTGARLDHLFYWAGSARNVFPFYRLDPLEKDAIRQVGLAVKRGVAGFKVMCDRFYPGDARALKVFRCIAENNKPILFHSGILWDLADSSRYHRPVEFESLIHVPHLRFALAHISWPWCDEAIAVFGKFLHVQRTKGAVCPQMYIDTTPGTPPIYRHEALSRLFGVGYPLSEKVFFGTDNSANDYDVAGAKTWIQRDLAVFKRLKLKREVIQNVMGKNLERFLGVKLDS
ncbi:MAG: amidohydrolase family protein [Verrucomicrobiae bacterium]|nr:amidohydrolase family protein [Verrucomicrobiae bacterium]